MTAKQYIKNVILLIKHYKYSWHFDDSQLGLYYNLAQKLGYF